MSPKKCKFNEKWLSKLDLDNMPISRWLRPDAKSATTAHCIICSTTLHFNLKGFQSIQQHMKTIKHKENLKSILAPSQLKLSGTGNTNSKAPSTETCLSIDTCSSSSSVSNSTPAPCSTSESTLSQPPAANSISQAQNVKRLTLSNPKHDSIKAEIIWTLKVVADNFSVRSCEDIKETFMAMFPNNDIVKDFSLGKFKLSYMLTDSVGPHFRDLFLEDAEGTFYSLCFDETTNNASKKELRTDIRYYSSKTKRIQQHHLESFFIENSTGDTIAKYLRESIVNGNIPMDHMLTIGRDGPNTNKKVFRLIDKDFKKETGKSLLNIGSCNIHTVHNGFKEGLKVFGDDVSDLVIQLFHFFDDEPLRVEEFKKSQSNMKVPTHKMIKHVSSRWLTLHESTSRVKEQWSAILEYFLKDLPKNRPKGTESIRYKNIVKYLKYGTMEAEILFVIESAALLQPFLRYFQSTEPLIHKLQLHLTEMLVTILGRVGDPKQIVQADKITIASFETNKLRPIEQIHLTDEIIAALDKCKDADKLKFKLNVRNHFVAIGEHIVQKTSYDNDIVKALKYIAPDHILKPESGEKIISVAKQLPFPIPSTALDEWNCIRAYVEVQKLQAWKGRIDDFWTIIFELKGLDELPRFPVISKIMKCFLALTHGAGDIERGFSDSALIMTEDKTQMTDRTLNARLNIKSGLKSFYQNSPVSVPIDGKFIKSAQSAFQNYKMFESSV